MAMTVNEPTSVAIAEPALRPRFENNSSGVIR